MPDSNNVYDEICINSSILRCMYACMHVAYVCLCIYVCMYECMCVCVYYMNVCMCMCICVYVRPMCYVWTFGNDLRFLYKI